MKKITKIIIATSILSIGVIVSGLFSPKEAHGNISGAPAGRTGSPGDGMNCTNSCHAGASTTGSNMITSNIPGTGYVAGVTYTITASAIPSGASIPVKYGFQVSPQNTAGAQRGTLIVTNTTETQLVGSGKYITHKTAGTSLGTGIKTWTFNWTAPASGQGPVTFYGAFLFANGNGSNSGDAVVLASLTVSESTIGIDEQAANENNWSVYPNPAANEIQITNALLNKGEFDVAIFDITGKKVKEIKAYSLIQKSTIDISDLDKGIYVVSISSENATINKKIIKQ